MTGNPEIQKLLMQAMQARQNGDMEGAEAACRSALALDPEQPDALQFLGLIAETKGELDEAEALMSKSLAASPDQPHVLNNLANLFHKKERHQDAIGLLEKAVQLQPDYADAWFNLGKVLFDLEEFERAIPALEKAKTAWRQKDPKPHTLLGDIHSRLENFEGAENAFKEALALNPHYFNALHNYGLVLKQEQKLDEALSVFERAKAVNPAVAELYYNMANVYFEKGDYDTSTEMYQKSVELKPDSLVAHRALNEVIWRNNRRDQYLASYLGAITRVEDSLELRLEYADALIKVTEMDKAEEILDGIFKDCPPSGKAFHLLARIRMAEKGFSAALKALDQGIELNPNEIEFKKDKAKVLIGQERYDAALVALEDALEIKPFQQEIIAYQGLCWRLLGDEREPWLNNYDAFVKPYLIDIPDGYKDLDDFNRALNQALDPFHTAKMQPSNQTLRGGTQTMAELLYRNVKEIRDLRHSFERTIEKYIKSLPDDPSHPFLSRKTSSFRFSGSWSVRLKDKGFHVNHVHPEGWISASYYVALPDIVANSDSQQGWIKFGESPLNLGDKEVIRKIIQPKVGLLVLFPSYTWHGTVPFSSSQERTTLPFDAVPVS